ncbi:MAG: tRNA pseudouridine(13) synthase TruD [Planctomycetes bacterium]|nr:tRNA pseudouridine(13) synthase TruD [Planctomycetota bacterium]
MKLKRLPEDFQVEELTQFPCGSGPFALYRLKKRSIGTPEAIEAVLRRWKLARRQISYGGMKDRHAVTEQFVTIERGPRRNLTQASFTLLYQGQAASSFGPKDIAGNRFRIVIRDLSEEQGRDAVQALAQAARDGLPNYFDDQRFGSLGESGQFMARAWCESNYERALWLALADPNADDRSPEREQKRLLRAHWGDWPACKAALLRSHRRSIITYLADHPADFRGAIGRLRADLRSLYLAAFQSFLWNRLLAAFLRQECRPQQLFDVPLRIGSVPFFRPLDDAQRESLRTRLLPLPSARMRLEEGPTKQLVEQVLGELGLQQRQLRVKYPRDSFFSKGNRAAIFPVTALDHRDEADDLYARRRKLMLRFDLPRGSYATILVKRLTS